MVNADVKITDICARSLSLSLLEAIPVSEFECTVWFDLLCFIFFYSKKHMFFFLSFSPRSGLYFFFFLYFCCCFIFTILGILVVLMSHFATREIRPLRIVLMFVDSR